MKKYKLVLDSIKYPQTGEEIEMTLTDGQVQWVKKGIELGIKVPLYSTTMSKAKYGDCIIGNIIGLK